MAEPEKVPFVMHGARDAIAAGLAHIERHVEALEEAVVENPSLAFDLAKSLIESACRTVLQERSVSYAVRDDLPSLFRLATRHLSLLPEGASDADEVGRSIRQTLQGLGTAVQGICELRNQCGFVSHGSGAQRPVMEAPQALLAAQIADTIIGFLHRMHRQEHTSSAILNFENNETFNNHVDENCDPVIIFDVEFRPSQVLFEMEPESYRIYLAEFEDSEAGGSGSADARVQP